jgi:hypothetical protein
LKSVDANSTGSKLKAAHAVFAWLAVALGAAHVLFTFYAYGRLSLGAFWFAGSGVGIIFAGFVNLMLNRGALADALSRWLCHTTNAVCASLFAVGLFLIGEPQVFFGLFLFAFQLVAAALLSRRNLREVGVYSGAK